MTTSAAEAFTTVTQAGSGLSWSGLSNLEYGGAGSATAGPTTIFTLALKEVYFAVPNFISSIGDGAEFVSLRISFYASHNQGSAVTFAATLTGGGAQTESVASGETVVFDGDSTYWGLSGSASEIFADLKSGAIKLKINETTRLDAGVSLNLSSVTATLTYREPDTLRASVIAALP